jgi:hypothetical protein
MARLYIGSYIIDEADSGSTSTTSGVQLDIGDADDVDAVAPEIIDGADGGGGSEYRWPMFYAVVTAASESALKTAVDAFEAAVLNCSGKTITFENTNGTTLFQMIDTSWPDAKGSMKKHYDALRCEIAFSFIGFRAGTPASGAASETGQVGPITWEYEISAGGLAGMVARAVFAAGTSGARANANTWINKLRNTANYPSWLPTALRMVGAVVEFDQKANEASLSETSFDPARVTLTFRELPETLATTVDTKVLAVNWNVAMTERKPLNQRAPGSAGADLVLFGDLTLKTEGNTTFNASETSLADNAIYGIANAAVALIIAQFRTVYQSLALTQWGNAVLNIDEVQGIVGFAVHFTANCNVLEWEETCVIRNQFQKVWSRASDGSDWVYEKRGGPIKTCTHSLRIVAVSAPQPYRPPTLNPNWDEVDAGLEPTIRLKHNNGQTEYHTAAEKTWRYVNRGPTDGRGQTTTLTPKDMDSIGDGRI